eukprot:scaffold66669_cov45-Attheya_sp.AAC.1
MEAKGAKELHMEMEKSPLHNCLTMGVAVAVAVAEPYVMRVKSTGTATRDINSGGPMVVVAERHDVGVRSSPISFSCGCFGSSTTIASSADGRESPPPPPRLRSEDANATLG